MLSVRQKGLLQVICRIGSLENKSHALCNPGEVICRIGSLEKSSLNVYCVLSVICRIGSLENFFLIQRIFFQVICRIGSLEIPLGMVTTSGIVICRIGSLEILPPVLLLIPGCYLPYRQLRKVFRLSYQFIICYRRIGSLENFIAEFNLYHQVNCRIGSLEM